MNPSRRTAAALLACALCAVCALAGPALVTGAAGGHARGQRSNPRPQRSNSRAQRSGTRRAGACPRRRRHRCRSTPHATTRHAAHRRRAEKGAARSPAGVSGSAGAGDVPGSGSGGGSGAASNGSLATPGAGGGASGSASQPSTPNETPPVEAPGSGPAHVQVIAKEYSFTLSRSEVPAGKVVVEFVNGGEDPHNLHFTEPTEGAEAGAFPTSSPGFHGELTLNLHAGSYTLFCSLPGHEAKGMKATLIVR